MEGKHDVIAEMRIPVCPTQRIVAIILWIVIVTSIPLAILNVYFWASIPIISTVASVLWLIVMSIMISHLLRNRQVLIESVAELSHRQFVVAVNSAKGLVICFGYYFWGMRFHIVEIPVDTIESLKWSKGQASSMAGHDANDWTITLWHHPQVRRYPSFPGMRAAEPYCFGPPRPRQVTEALGHEFRNFLKSVGIQLHPTKNETEFWRVVPDESQVASPVSELA